MPLMERYIFRRITSAFLLALIVLVGTLWMTQVLKELDVLTTKGQTLWVFLVVTFLALPTLVQIIAPIAFLIAVVFVLNSLNAEGEMAAMTASGASGSIVGRPVFVLAMLLSLVIWLLYNIVSPYMLSELRVLIIQIRAEVIAALVKDGGFQTIENGLTVHIREKAVDGRFLGIFVNDDRNPQESLQYLAKSGALLQNERGTFLIMDDGDLVRQLPEDGTRNVVAFENYAFDLSQFTTADRTPLSKPRERLTSDLLTAGDDDSYKVKYPELFAAEIHARMTAPFYPVVFASILLSFLGRPRTNRQDRAYAIVVSCILCVLLFGAHFAALAMVETSRYLIYLLYLIPISGFVAGWLAMVMKARFRMPAFAERMVDAAGRSARAVGQRLGPNDQTGRSPA